MDSEYETLIAKNNKLRDQLKLLQEEQAANQRYINCRPCCACLCYILCGAAAGLISGLGFVIAYMTETHHC